MDRSFILKTCLVALFILKFSGNAIAVQDTLAHTSQEKKQEPKKSDKKEKPVKKEKADKPEIKEVPKARKQSRPPVVVKPKIKVKPIKIIRPKIKKP